MMKQGGKWGDTTCCARSCATPLAVCVLALPLLAALAGPARCAESAQGPGLASREQLRACLDSEEQLARRWKALEQQLAENSLAVKQSRQEATAIAEEQARLDTGQYAQVEEFNRRVSRHNAFVKTANGRALAIKADEDSYNRDSAAHNRTCGPLIFSVSDRENVLKERQNAAK